MSEIVAEELLHPFPLFRLCAWNTAKAMVLFYKLKDEPLYLPDELRNYGDIWKIIHHNFGWDKNHSLCLPYEIGDFDGVMVFQDIAKGNGCGMMLKFWGKQLWGADGARQAQGLIDFIMDKFDLKTIHIVTGDKQAVKLGKLFGFELKEIKKNAFRWNGNKHDRFRLEKGVR
jgi:hypothetical protein